MLRRQCLDDGQATVDGPMEGRGWQVLANVSRKTENRNTSRDLEEGGGACDTGESPAVPHWPILSFLFVRSLSSWHVVHQLRSLSSGKSVLFGSFKWPRGPFLGPYRVSAAQVTS